MLAVSSAIFSLLLITTGAAKVARPRDVEKALRSLGFPRLPGIGAVLGLTEIVVGVGALVFPGLLFVQGALYAIFAFWVAHALRKGVPIASCGCLGRDDTPPTGAHVALNVIGAFVSFGGALGSGLVFGTGIELVAQIAVVGVGLFLSYVVLSDAARLSGVRQT